MRVSPTGSEQAINRQVPIKNEIRLGQLFDHEVGEDSESGLNAEWRMQATYAVTDDTRVGLESFNDFGRLADLSGYSDQSHTIGPVVKGKLPNGFFYETGYRAGISDAAPDHLVKFFIGKDF